MKKMEQRGKGGEKPESVRRRVKNVGLAGSGKGSFGPYKVTLLEAHNAGKLLPPQI